MSNRILNFQQLLLSWYRTHARRLPWRSTHDPYKIWISEIMLQQTQVDTVIPYYQKWIKHFPTIASLADSPQAEVMKYWAGLGYYRRARMLHGAAKILVKNHGGKLPQSAEELRKLPGIGRYTAGAIASIAFNQKTPVLDGNVVRVLTRLQAYAEDITQTKTVAKLWEIAESLVPENNPGDFNQAMMELGATICAPENPKCDLCPVASLCTARKMKRATDFPVKKQKEKLEKIKTAALILRRGATVLIRKQADHERWGGLWMFPFDKDRKSLAKKFLLRPKELERRFTLFHGFTKYRVRLDVFEAVIARKPDPLRGQYKTRGLTKQSREIASLTSFARNDSANRWIKISELTTLALPSPHQKIAKEILENA
ncbi:MAG: A/G-specific adenine glycosylase [Candidatus Omnitrophica bacterium]|nr:A/G-specific adenine glycosylase [Candidatus Omnitrophota bacterium]